MQANNEWRVGVAGVVIDKGKALLVQHADGVHASRWSLPGGYSQADERLDQAVIRDLWEQTGLETRVKDIIGLLTRCCESGGSVFLVFRLDRISGKARPDGMKIKELAWFDFTQISAMKADEIAEDIRRPALAGLSQVEGLLEDRHHPAHSDKVRGYLASVELAG